MREILFENAVLTLRTLNIALALGFLFAGVFSIRYVEKHKMNLIFLTQYFLPILVVTLLAGRIFYAIEKSSFILQRPVSFFFIWDLGFSFFGLLAGAALALFYYTRKSREDFWAWIDVVALSSLALLVFAHLGFFFSGANYGIPTTLPWGIAFEAKHIPYISPLHPTQLYAMLLSLLLLARGVKRSKRIHLSGVVGTRAIMIYSLGMLGIDFLHGDPSLYTKIAYAALAGICFVASVHCNHKTHVKS